MKKSLKKLSKLTIAVLSLSLTGLTSNIVSAQDIIATIGGTEITKDEFYDSMKNLAGVGTLRTMILEYVLEQNATDPAALMATAEEETQQQIDQVGGEEAFQQLLDYQNFGTIENYTYNLYVGNLLSDVLKQNADMSDEALLAYYETDYQPSMEASHILVETEEEALAAIARLDEGEEFETVAQELSLDTSAANGGYLGEFASGQMVPEFEEAVKNTPNDEYTPEPVKSDYGYHVIKVHNNGEKKPFEESREEVEISYFNSIIQDDEFVYGTIGQLIEAANVTINDPDLEGAISDLTALVEELAQAPGEEVPEAAEEETSAAEE